MDEGISQELFMNLDGIDLLNKKEELTEQLNQAIDDYEQTGYQLAKAERDYKVLYRQKALTELNNGMKVTFISQFLVGDEGIAEKRFQRDCAETKYKTLNEKINALKLQLRINESATVREWTRYDND